MKTPRYIYFDQVAAPRVTNHCRHWLSDLLLVSICTFLTGGSDYHEMYLLAKERGPALKAQGLLQLPNGTPSSASFSASLQACLAQHGQALLNTLAEKQIAIDGKKLRGASPTSKGNSVLYMAQRIRRKGGHYLLAVKGNQQIAGLPEQQVWVGV
jgi:hypothetical protein